MGRRKKKEAAKAEPGAPLWMVTYSDMVTLLLCFFVMQLVYANFEDPGKVEAALESIKSAFGTGSVHHTKPTEPTPSKSTDMSESAKEQNEQLVEALQSVLAEMISQNLVRMTQTKTEIRIQLDEMVLFRPGSAVLNPVSLGLLNDIATAVHGYPVLMIVEGHADADGTSEEKNWMMSATRAVAVVSEFRRRKDEKGKALLDGEFLEARGMGEFRPADVEKGQSKWNRRVELVIRGRNTSAIGAIEELDQVLGE